MADRLRELDELLEQGLIDEQEHAATRQAILGSLNIGGILVSVPQLIAGVIAAALTIAMHLLLTRTTIGSKLLAVAEDRNAAMLMGIRPDRMQALAWGLSAASAGIAGALMAMSYPWSPSVGETFGLTAFVVVAFGGFGSVPGAMYAGPSPSGAP